MARGAQTKPANILERLVSARRRALAQAQARLPASELEGRAAAAPPPRDFSAALTRDSLNIIAELKKSSPSRGLLRADFEPARLARALAAAGAAALSVLTEPEFFQGSLDHLAAAREAARLPVLRKDFLFDPYQVVEARAAGADAFLLIAAILSPGELRRLITLGRQLGMAALVEVHTEGELEQVLGAGAELVGVNNRDLKNFEIKRETSLRLIERIPKTCVAVSESGLASRAQLLELRAAGFDAFLIGEHLMVAPDPAQALRELLSEDANTP